MHSKAVMAVVLAATEIGTFTRKKAEVALRGYCAAVLMLMALPIPAQESPNFGPADPVSKDAGHFDARRPVSQEMQTDVSNGFTVGTVGDLAISRPLSQYAGQLPGFKSVLRVLHGADVVSGNLETVIFDARSFKGAPYSWDGDWTDSSLPEVAKDLRDMGFNMVGRANNHSLDWGLEGMRETGQHLDLAGIVHAGVGEDRGLARAPQYLETAKGRVALVSIASTFRPTTDALPHQDAAPGRPGLSALHVTRTIRVPESVMKALAGIDCGLFGNQCQETSDSLELFDAKFRLGSTFAYEYEMDPEDLADILKNIRSARENADFVIVAIHAHECTTGCDDPNQPRGPGDFLKQLAHAAIDSGADLFFTAGNHNLGPIELYRSPARGVRPIFYGLGDFFWSDIQEPLPHDLFQRNRPLLAAAWKDPSKATNYDLTALLDRKWFANSFTFQSVIAVSRFDGNQLAEVRLYAVEDGYGDRLPKSGIPRLVTDRTSAETIFKQITAATTKFDLPPLFLKIDDGVATIRPTSTPPATH
jgi:poly-gamma-glutamate capsule biosynthesis protein CapA/YwtB (metallophosphatase superfamily)